MMASKPRGLFADVRIRMRWLLVHEVCTSMPVLAQVGSRSAGQAMDSIERLLQAATDCALPVRSLAQRSSLLLLQQAHDVAFVHLEDGRHGAPRGTAVALGYVCIDRTPPASEEVGRQLLRMWQDEGVAFLQKLEGSFSLILYLEHDDRLLIATDSQGSRPLWQASRGDCHVFSDDLAAAAASLPGPLALDRAYLWSFFRHGRSIGAHSPFESIRAMEAGEAMEFHAGSLHRRARYTDPVFRPESGGVGRFAARLVDAVTTTVQQACATARAPALLLSGGLDSRLVAGACPANVVGVTLADTPNAETAAAARVAGACGLSQRLILRDAGWYPGLMQPASRLSAGVWTWNQAHYLPLAEPQWDYGFDVTVLGYGSDTYFKGDSLKWPRLWDRPAGRIEDHLLRLFTDFPLAHPQGAQVLRAEVRADCEQANREAASAMIEQVARWGSCVPDMWELFWTHGLNRLRAGLNLVCLRRFTSERNAFSSRRVQQLYLATPAKARASGEIIRRAVWHIGKKLVWIPDANTWLPAGFPGWVHRSAMLARRQIALARQRVRRRQRSGNYVSHCSWPHFDRFWLCSPAMRSAFESLLADDSALPDTIFDKDAIQRFWVDHAEGRPVQAGLFDAVATFGLLHRHIQSSR